MFIHIKTITYYMSMLSFLCCFSIRFLFGFPLLYHLTHTLYVGISVTSSSFPPPPNPQQTYDNVSKPSKAEKYQKTNQGPATAQPMYSV